MLDTQAGAPRQSEAAGLSCQSNTRLFGKLFFCSAEPFAVYRAGKPCSEPGALAGELSILRSFTKATKSPAVGSPPSSSCLQRAAWPLPVPGTLAPAVAAVPLPSRTRGLGTEAWPPASLALWGAGQGWDLQRLYCRNYKGADFPTDASIAALRKCVSRGGPPASWCFGELTGTAHTVFNN